MVAQPKNSEVPTLEDLGWPQAATPITSDNSTAIGIGTRKSKQRRSKAIDMRYHWIRDRVDQNNFTLSWAPGSTNRADFFTKLHSATRNKEHRRHYVVDPKPPALGPPTLTPGPVLLP